MTPTEREQVERELLLDIVIEASKWRISEEDDRDPIRIEVEQRLSKLVGTTTKTVAGREQSVKHPTVVDDQKPRSNHREIHFKDKSGHSVWCARDEAVKVVRDGAGCPWKWVLKTELTDDDVLYEDEPT